MKNTKDAQARLLLAAFLIIASPFLAYLIPKVFTSAVCHIPEDLSNYYWFPCSEQAFYLGTAGLIAPLIIAACLLLWHHKYKSESKK